ncbi:lactaldehyde dehydrogenase [Klebsiella pneumoniae]|uniref:Lactaldehyde dehydrogenase n=1 Tax=Klebsiella pneumoniae TaxID=573 RepID=A0A3S5DHI6_KLEPN|nr:lactaldehyde dehydrogenase [Klebsiella pneumoniae]
MSFMLALPKISLHGAGAIGDMVKLVAGKQWGKALIVTDGQLVKLGLLDSLFAALDEQQMAYQLFDEVFPNPTEALVQQGYAAYQAARCDYLIAFGGGSPIDTAKAIKILTANPGPSTAYSGVGKVKNGGVPLVAINTTAGTAAEMTSNAVIIDSERQVKEVIIDPNLIPDIAVDDASVMLDIPPAVTAATGMDALTPRHRGLCLRWRPSPDRRQRPRSHPPDQPVAAESGRRWTRSAGPRADGVWPVSGGHGVQQRRPRAGTCPGPSAWRHPQPAARGMQRHPAADHRKTLTARTRWRALPAWRRRWASILAA